MTEEEKRNLSHFLVPNSLNKNKHPHLGCMWIGLEIDSSKKEKYIDYLSKAIQEAYVDPQYLSKVLKQEGFSGVAEYLLEKFPENGGQFDVRKGDFGEVLGHAVLVDLFGYKVPVFKLRYKTNPQKAVFGVDIIAFRINENDPKEDTVVFGEVKTSKKKGYGVKNVFDEINLLTQSDKPEAKQKMLNAVRFVSERLHEQKDYEMENRINRFLNCFNHPHYIEGFYPFLIREKNTWNSSVLDSMAVSKPDQVILCVVTIENLEEIIEEAYRKAAQMEQEIG